MTFLYFSMKNPSLVAVRQGVGWVGPFVCCSMTVLTQHCDSVGSLPAGKHLIAISCMTGCLQSSRTISSELPVFAKQVAASQDNCEVNSPSLSHRVHYRSSLHRTKELDVKVRCISLRDLPADHGASGRSGESKGAFFPLSGSCSRWNL